MHLLRWFGYVWMVIACAHASAVDFDNLLQEAHMELHAPAGFQASKKETAGLCNKVIEATQSQLQVCVIVRPLARMIIDYEDPHSSAPDPNQIYPLLFTSLSQSLSDGSALHSAEYPSDLAAKLFRAHWASAAAMTLNPEWAFPYPNGLMIGIHRDGSADAYLIFSYADHETAKTDIQNALPLIRFSTAH